MALSGRVGWLLVDRLLTTDNAGFFPFWHRPTCRRRRIFTEGWGYNAQRGGNSFFLLA